MESNIPQPGSSHQDYDSSSLHRISSIMNGFCRGAAPETKNRSYVYVCMYKARLKPAF